MKKVKKDDMLALLKRLKKVGDETDGDGFFVQRVLPPELFPRGIPTLEPGVYREPSPMVRQRFEFAGAWENAGLNQKWLGIGEMEKAWKDRKIIRQIKVRKEDWDDSVVQDNPFERITLFSIDLIEKEETYLLWSEKGNGEPKVVNYSSQRERGFKNLGSLVEFLTKARTSFLDHG